MSSKGKKSTSVPGSKGRTPSSSHSVISNSGRSMPPTTRSMQGRLSGTSQASSPQAQAGPSRGAVQQGTSQRVMTAAVSKGSNAESSDEDEAEDDDQDDDDDGGEDGENSDDDDDDDDDDEASNNARSASREYSDDDDDDVKTKVLKIFATTEPNGLTKSEIIDPGVIQNQANPGISIKYRALVSVVTQQAMESPAFYNKLLECMNVPGDEWSLLMYSQLRTRFQGMIWRFDTSASGAFRNNTVIKTATHLGDLVKAIKSLTKPTNWQQMAPTTRLQYFGLVLEVLGSVIARDQDSRSARSSPYAVETANDHNLYLQMVGTGKCSHTMSLLHGLFNRLQAPLPANQADDIRSLLRKVQDKHERYGNMLQYSVHFVAWLRSLAAAVSPPRRS